MDKKILIYGALIMITLFILLVSFGVIQLKSSSSTAASAETGDMPEKCKIGQGYNLQSWKEHLGHHAETQESLKYYN